ncbi:MAG: MBL fold metallo-hydrolase [Deltaproteobacteria bacterium]|nr:MBL fold metallo-hydrolase [Deltaproteobacteria bacterium]
MASKAAPRQIVPIGNLSVLHGDNWGKFPLVNSLFLRGPVRVVVDPGSNIEFFEEILREGPVQILLNTHYHGDHTRHNRLFSESALHVSEADAPVYHSLDNLAAYIGRKGRYDEDMWRQMAVEERGYTPRSVDVAYRDGEVYRFGETTVEIVQAPGHTPGHSCLLFRELSAIYLADIDLTRFGPWYGNAASDIDLFLESIERVSRIQADWYIPAHGPIIPGDRISGRFEAFAKVIHDREERILELLREPHTVAGIVATHPIYRRQFEPKDVFDFMEEMMVVNHLRRSLRLQQIDAIEEGRYRAR